MKKSAFRFLVLSLILAVFLFLAACGSQSMLCYERDSEYSIINTDAKPVSENIYAEPEIEDIENVLDAQTDDFIQEYPDIHVPQIPLADLIVEYVHPLYISVYGIPLFSRGTANSSPYFNLQQDIDGSWADTGIHAMGFISVRADGYENSPSAISWDSPLPIGEFRISFELQHFIWPQPIGVRENVYVYFTVERELDPIEMIMYDLRLYIFRAEVVTALAYLYEWSDQYSEYLILEFLYPLQYTGEAEGFTRAFNPMYADSDGERDNYLWWHRFYHAVALSPNLITLNSSSDIIDAKYIPQGTIVDIWVNHHVFLDGYLNGFEIMYLLSPRLIKIAD